MSGLPVKMTVQMLRDFIRENYHKDSDVIVENNKVYVKIPLDALMKYVLEGDSIVVEIGG